MSARSADCAEGGVFCCAVDVQKRLEMQPKGIVGVVPDGGESEGVVGGAALL